MNRNARIVKRKHWTRCHGRGIECRGSIVRDRLFAACWTANRKMIPENNARPEDILAFDVTITAAQSNFSASRWCGLKC